MNPNCSIELAAFTVEEDHKPIAFDSFIGRACPALIYVAIPYMVAMKNGVRFPWEKGIDSVRVTCPAGHVDFELRDLKENAFRITIIHQDGNCPKQASNDVIAIPMQESKMRAFNDVFPFFFRVTEDNPVVLRGNVSIRKSGAVSVRPARELSPCYIEGELSKADVLVDVKGMKRSCAYHRRARAFPKEDLAPPGLCAMVYHIAYPTFLAMLYGKQQPDSVSLSCPGAGSRVEFVLERRARVIKPFLEVLEKFLSFTPLRLDIIKYRVKLKVVSIEGLCEEHMKGGYSFTLGSKRYLCPSSFYSLFPALLSWLGIRNQVECTCTCTSVPCHITYKIRPILEKERR